MNVIKDTRNFKIGDRLCRTLLYEDEEGYRFRIRLEKDQFQLRGFLDREMKMGKFDEKVYSKTCDPSHSMELFITEMENHIEQIRLRYDVSRVNKQRYCIRMMMQKKRAKKPEDDDEE